MENYNLQKMQELLRDFYNLTNMKTCIYDNAGNELCYYSEKLSPFCALLRKNPEMEKRCQACDKQAFAQCRKTYKQYVYTCHAGLLECVSPILYDQQIIGYIVIGQIKAKERSDFSLIEKNLPEDLKGDLKKQFKKLPDVQMDKINSAMRILDACTGYKYLKALVNSAESKIDILLGRYIHENLTEDLSVQVLCSQFHLSRSEVYNIFKEYFHSTPAEYIKSCRLDKACKLLNATSMPVNVIAKECGIPDYNYFSKIFKRTFGVSPRAFRMDAVSDIKRQKSL